MYGAILGDIIGSIYEFDFNNIKTKNFPLFQDTCHFTDDTVMTIAIAEALFECDLDKDYEYNADLIIKSMKKWGSYYPNAGYGHMFLWWLNNIDSKPYNSYGNGSAMRVSPVGWLYDNIEDTRRMAKITAQVTHNHPEGIKGAEATASAMFLARTTHSKEKIKEYIEKEFHYDLNRTCDEIRPNYHHVESCQETVPEAIIAFLEGTSFEDCIRNAVSLGGDSDTLTCITGGIAEAFYGVPEPIFNEGLKYLNDDFLPIIAQFYETIVHRHSKDSEIKLYTDSEEAMIEYEIQHKILRDIFFMNTKTLMGAMSVDTIFELYNTDFMVHGKINPYAIYAFDVDLFREDEILIARIHLPVPYYSPLCHRIYLVYDLETGKKGFYTIERSYYNEFLCEWVGTNHINHHEIASVDWSDEEKDMMLGIEANIIYDLFIKK